MPPQTEASKASSAEQVGWGMRRGPQPTRGLRDYRELPRRGPWQSPDRKCILSYFEDHRTLLFAAVC